MVQPIRPGAGVAPASAFSRHQAAAPKAGDFAGRLAQQVGEGTGPAPVDLKLMQVQRFAAQSLGTEAWEARLVETYDALSADEALYEVQTSRGAFQVIRSRAGSLSIY
jgi:hypothetical protein